MKAIYLNNQEFTMNRSTESIPVEITIHENHLKIRAVVNHEMVGNIIRIQVFSPYFRNEAHVLLRNNQVIIQAGISIEIKKSYSDSHFIGNKYFTLNTVYAIIKSSRIDLPKEGRYSLVSYSMAKNGILLLNIRNWNHTF